MRYAFIYDRINIDRKMRPEDLDPSPCFRERNQRRIAALAKAENDGPRQQQHAAELDRGAQRPGEEPDPVFAEMFEHDHQKQNGIDQRVDQRENVKSGRLRDLLDDSFSPERFVNQRYQRRYTPRSESGAIVYLK